MGSRHVLGLADLKLPKYVALRCGNLGYILLVLLLVVVAL